MLNQHVLVLNRLWQAVNICTARRALTLLFQGHAQAVLSSEDGSFRTYNFTQWYDFSLRERGIASAGLISRVPSTRGVAWAIAISLHALANTVANLRVTLLRCG